MWHCGSLYNCEHINIDSFLPRLPALGSIRAMEEARQRLRTNTKNSEERHLNSTVCPVPFSSAQVYRSPADPKVIPQTPVEEMMYHRRIKRQYSWSTREMSSLACATFCLVWELVKSQDSAFTGSFTRTLWDRVWRKDFGGTNKRGL